MRRRVATAYGLLIAGNAAAWLCALMEFHDRPVLLGTAFLAYSFGLRHGHHYNRPARFRTSAGTG